jgi:hypothetical protein
MLGTSRRSAVVSAIGICALVTIWLSAGQLQDSSFGSSIVSSISQHTSSTTSGSTTASIVKNGHLPAPVSRYFNQVFSPEDADHFDYPALKKACDRATWHEDVYLQCGGMFAGMTSIMSEVKVCFKMAVEAGAGLVLPTIPIRDNTNLLEFNNNEDETGDAYMPYDQWFDTKHLIEVLGRTCPKMNIIHPDQLKPDHVSPVAVKNHWEIDVSKAPGYHSPSAISGPATHSKYSSTTSSPNCRRHLPPPDPESASSRSRPCFSSTTSQMTPQAVISNSGTSWLCSSVFSRSQGRLSINC